MGGAAVEVLSAQSYPLREPSVFFSFTLESAPSGRDASSATPRAGEALALEEAYDKYSRPVFALLLRMTQDRAAAEDLLQETFLRVWRSGGSFDPNRGALLPWLLTVARNLALDRFRSSAERQRRRESLAETAPEPWVKARGEAWVDGRREAESVRETLDKFPPEQRRAIELAYFEGMSHSEVAAAMDRPLGAVKTWIRTALLALREELGGAA